METYLSNFIVLTAGIVVTLLISRHYFHKSLNRSLTPYTVFYSSPLNGIADDVRSALDIKYANDKIEYLTELEFLIANTGEISVRDMTDPLTLIIPNNSKLLDASIVFISPSGRDIKLYYNEKKSEVYFDFSILNKKEFFIIKLLLSGQVIPSDFKFKVSAEDLPPFLYPKALPSGAVSSKKDVKKGFDRIEFGLLIFGILFLLFGLSISVLSYYTIKTLPDFSIDNIQNFFVNMKLIHYTSLISTLPSLIFILIGIMMSASSFTGGIFPPQKTLFTLPDDKEYLIGRYRRFAAPRSPRVAISEEPKKTPRPQHTDGSHRRRTSMSVGSPRRSNEDLGE